MYRPPPRIKLCCILLFSYEHPRLQSLVGKHTRCAFAPNTKRCLQEATCCRTANGDETGSTHGPINRGRVDHTVELCAATKAVRTLTMDPYGASSRMDGYMKKGKEEETWIERRVLQKPE